MGLNSESREGHPLSPRPAVLRAAASNWASGMKGNEHAQATSPRCLPPRISFILFSFVRSLDTEGLEEFPDDVSAAYSQPGERS